MNLDDLLRILARKGYWITAWYPLSNGDFECRITGGTPDTGAAFGLHENALVCLRDAMTKAHLL